MTEISAKIVKELRDMTGVGMMDCKKALQEVQGDLEKAADWLRKQGMIKVAKKAGRIAAEGAVSSYIHMGGKIGVLCEINCESDFVARGETFQAFVKDVCMHIAATDPRYVRREEVDETAVVKERAFFTEEVKASGKPEKIVDKIVEGKMDKWFQDICLVEQEFVKPAEDGKKRTVEEVRAEAVQKTGENIHIRRFVRFVLGEGIEKKKESLAEEVAKMNDAVRTES